MKINNEYNDIPFCKRAFSDVMEDVTIKTFLVQALRPPFYNEMLKKKICWCMLFEPVVQICKQIESFQLSTLRGITVR